MLLPPWLAALLSSSHLQILLIYTLFMGFGGMLVLAHNWSRKVNGNKSKLHDISHTTGPTGSKVQGSRNDAVSAEPITVGGEKDSVIRKFPVYALLALTYLSAAWMPRDVPIFVIFLALISLGASWEICRVLQLSRVSTFSLVLASFGLVLASGGMPPEGWLKTWMALILVGTAVSALTNSTRDVGRQSAALGGGLIYLPICLVSLVRLWQAENGDLTASFLYLSVSVNDTFGQITGQWFGTVSLIPRLSPAKTREGALGGILFSALIGACLGPVIGWTIWRGLVLGLAAALTGLAGDLVESSWKRALGIKDFSRLLGANGGVFDRYDSLLFAAPIFYLLISL